MSLDAMRWAFQQEVKPAARKFVLVALGNQVRKGNTCWPSVNTISKDTGQSRSSAITHLSELEKSGHITRETRGGSGGGRKSNVYRLNMETQSPDIALSPKVQDSDFGGQSPDIGRGKVQILDGQSPTFGGQSPESGPEPVKEPIKEQPRAKPPVSPLPKKKKATKQEIDVPDFIDSDLWFEYVQHRKEIRKKVTPTSARNLIKELTKAHDEGMDVNAAIRESLASGWQGIFPKHKTRSRGSPSVADKVASVMDNWE